TILWRTRAAADLGLLAPRFAHLSSSDPGADVASVGRPARPHHLRPVGRCEMGRSRSDVFTRGREARRVAATRSSPKWGAENGNRKTRRAAQIAHFGAHPSPAPSCYPNRV